MRGYCGIGIYNGKTEVNVGTLWRSAYCFDADFIFTIGKRYKKQASDTVQAHRHIPLWHFDTFEDFHKHIPYDCQLVGVELCDGAKQLETFVHPERAIYILGQEDSPNGKPAPDLFLLAAKKMGVPPAQCLVFEDAETGIRAAQAAGMDWVKVE